VLEKWAVSAYYIVMRNRSRKKKRPRDPNLLAKSIVDEATEPERAGQQDKESIGSGKNPAAVELGRLGGLKGGKARWKGTTKKQRSEAARKAAMARWQKRKEKRKTPTK
jgi:hypothetical protein